MHPILWTIAMSPSSARVAGVVAAILLSLFVVWDGYREHGREKLGSTLVQAALFLAISLYAALTLLTPERLPEVVTLDIRSWGIASIAGMCACFLIQRRLGRDVGLDEKTIFSLWVWGGLGAIIGARGLQVAVNWPAYRDQPLAALAFWDGGMAYLGGVVVALSVGVFLARRYHLGLRTFDVLALGVALSQGIGRVGCFLAGCCYGKETTLPIGVRFPAGSIAHHDLVLTGVIPESAAMTPPLHPAQLYEAFGTFAIGGGLLAWFLLRRPKPGLVVAGYFIAYSLVRFVIELVRNDPDRQFLFRFPEVSPLVLSTSQTAGILLSAIALVVARRLARREA